jgi:hypothetical protein
MELEWPIEGAEPLSFVLTRLLEPLSARLERRDRGAAALHVHLRLVTKEVHAQRLLLPSPLRDMRTLRTLALLDLETHPPPAAIDHVTVTIDPTPARVVQHALFTRAVPTPDQLATLLARLGALMGQDRIGAAATLDSDRPGAFVMKPFATDHAHERSAHRTRRDPVFANAADDDRRTARRERGDPDGTDHPRAHREWARIDSVIALNSRRCSSSADATSASAAHHRAAGATAAVVDWNMASAAGDRDLSATVVSALRRCRQPVPARVAIGPDERPVHVTTDRRGFAGGAVLRGAGPWRTSGEWWELETAGGAGRAGGWNRDEWDVALADGAVYRIFRDRVTGGWFIDAIVD